MFFSPKLSIKVVEILSAAPLTSSILPKAAPRQMMSAKPPRVLPTPFSMDAKSDFKSIPNINPAVIATIKSDKNGLTFLVVRNT